MEAMERFVASMLKFEEYLKSAAQEGEGEEEGEYYDEEEGGEEY